MATTLPVDPLESPTFVLAGRVVTMNATRDVIANGVVCIHAGQIVAVQAAAAPLPAAFANAPRIGTEGTIYPGLIDLHNHLSYNVLPLWNVPKRFTNRGQWASHADKRRLISQPMEILARTPGQIEAVVRYVETKCLVAGVTTSQGVTLVSDAGIVKRYRGIVRNVEQTDDDTLPEALARIADVDDAAAFMRRLKRATTLFLHLSEGVDASARKHFNALRLNGEWAINKALAGIHCCGLQGTDFDTLSERGGHLVWSPLSNLLLYGQTVDIARAKQSGVTFALGPDWSPSGSKNLLGEMKFAQLVSEAAGGVFSPRELVEMATINAARVLKWDAALGSIEAGKRADLMVVAGTAPDAYLHLIGAKETDVDLVIINGTPRFGLREHVEPFETMLESIQVGGEPRVLNLQQATADPIVSSITFARAKARLADGLARLPELAGALNRAQARGVAFGTVAVKGGRSRWSLLLDNEPDPARTVRALAPKSRFTPFSARAAAKVVPPSITLDPLTTADDAAFIANLNAQRNLPDFIKQGLVRMFG